MKIIIFAIILFVSGIVYSQSSVSGHWEGKIDIAGTVLFIKTDFKTEPDSIRGTMDIPEQKALGMKLIHIKMDGQRLSFELPAGPGLAVFEGLLNGDSINGDFKQAGIKGKFFLIKGEFKEEIKIEENLPYNSEEVTFSNGENKFAGTLTTPFSKGKHPAVVMITGSGAQNRNEDIFGFKIFKVISDHLTRNGIAVLRYDDRNTGASTGKSVSSSTTEDFAFDVIEAVKFLKTRADINPEQIGLMGHSEGGIVAPLVVSKYNEIAFIVLMAGTGVKGIDIIREQSKLIGKTDKAKEDDIKLNDEMLEIIGKINSDSTNKNYKSELKNKLHEAYEKMSDEEKNRFSSEEEFMKLSVSTFENPWMKYFLSYNPYPALTKVKCPVLMLFGGKDLQVPVYQNEGPMVNALKEAGNRDYTVKTFPDANHLFQTASTGSPTEYSILPKEFTPGFLETVSEWILKRVTAVK